MLSRRMVVIMAGFAACAATSVRSDEGMWAFNNLPLKQLKEKYGFEPTPQWIEHVQRAAVRFNSGGSGSFISPDGLVMTNHHVGADTLQKISTPEHDYYKLGFHAKSRGEEVPAKDLELNVVESIEDVTDRVNAQVKDGMTDADAEAARRRAIADIEKESLDRTGLRSDVVKLYQGGQYHLYRYKTYTDVRLVFAPEFDIAFFGGDPDNFEYPRYDLDVCFFRAYEDGKPARIEHFLTWSRQGTQEGDLVFVAGNPGRTSRLNTVAHLEYLRDTAFPFLLDVLHDREAFLSAFSKRGAEQARQAKEDLFGIQNSRKAREGGLKGLKDAEFFREKQTREQALRSRVAADAEQKRKYGDAWDRIAETERVAARTLPEYNFLERGLAFDSDLFRIARTLVRMAEEDAKPNADRLREYQAAGRKPLELQLYSEAPIYPEFEKARLAHSLAYWRDYYGRHHREAPPLVEKVLQGRTPEQAAEALVNGTKLADVAVRRRIAEGGSQAIAESDDPMIALAKLVDPAAREVRKIREDQVEGAEASGYAKIARALFEEYGDAVYPDATFTLRLAFGVVKGYEQDGQWIAPYTTIGGAFEHAAKHGNQEPYKLPESWIEAKREGRLNLETPLNFVSTADIIGGNSGSPVIDRKGELVGIIFDGNIQSLVLDFGYDDRQARAVSVDCRAIIEALRSVYRADALLGEILR
jgi:hypothetical protein